MIKILEFKIRLLKSRIKVLDTALYKEHLKNKELEHLNARMDEKLRQLMTKKEFKEFIISIY